MEPMTCTADRVSALYRDIAEHAASQRDVPLTAIHLCATESVPDAYSGISGR